MRTADSHFRVSIKIVITELITKYYKYLRKLCPAFNIILISFCSNGYSLGYDCIFGWEAHLNGDPITVWRLRFYINLELMRNNKGREGYLFGSFSRPHLNYIVEQIKELCCTVLNHLVLERFLANAYALIN